MNWDETYIGEIGTLIWIIQYWETTQQGHSPHCPRDATIHYEHS